MRSKLHRLSEAELLHLYYRNDDIDALGYALQSYTVVLFGVAMKYVKNESIAQDVVQQTYAKAIEKLPKQVNNLGGWLYQVVRNECLDIMKKNNPIDYNADVNIGGEEDEMIDWKQLEENESILLDEVAALKEEQKVCIQLFYLKKMSYAEIASQTSMSTNEVKSHIQNGKRNLRLLLEKNPNFKRAK